MAPWGEGNCPHVLDRWCGSCWIPKGSHHDCMNSPSVAPIEGNTIEESSLLHNKQPVRHTHCGSGFRIPMLFWWIVWVVCWPVSFAFQLHHSSFHEFSHDAVVVPLYHQFPHSRYIWPHNSVCNDVVQGRFHEYFPIGEALNPGPSHVVDIDDQEFHQFAPQHGKLVIGTINPTQILGKETAIKNLGPGVWTCSETSHTCTSKSISVQRFRSFGLGSVWSCHNEPHSINSGPLRGKAAGTCIVSSLPLVESHLGIAKDVWNTCRYSEACVRVSPSCSILIISLYGPTYNGTHQDPGGLLQALCHTAFERALGFRGPVVIAGDLNTIKDNIPGWIVMKNKGWCDLHEVSMERCHHSEEATCKSARHSFLIANPVLAQSLIQCRAVETFDFSSHPVLFASFDLEMFVGAIRQWWLPKSTDDFFLDEDLMEHWAAVKLGETKLKSMEP